MNPVIAPRSLFLVLILLLALAFWLSLALGPVSLPLADTLQAALRLLGLAVGGDELQQAELILGQLRMPRALLGLTVGAVLALCGVAMQGLFRNPQAGIGQGRVDGRHARFEFGGDRHGAAAGDAPVTGVREQSL